MNATLAVQYILVNNSTYNAHTNGRVFYTEVEQGAVSPCCVVFGDSVAPNDTKDGKSTLDFDHVWVTHFAGTFKEVSQMAVDARNALDRVSGSYNGVTVVSIQFLDERDSSEQLVDGKKVTKEQLYQVMVTI